MTRSRSILAVAAGAALAALGWLAWRSTSAARAPIAAEGAAALAAPPAELLAELDSAAADAAPAPTIESQASTARESLEVRTIQTRSASIAVQPPKVEGENQGMIIVWCYLESSHASIDPEEIVLLAADGRALRGAVEQPKGTFRGLAGGAYSVLVRDSRFENVRIDSVATGSHVLIDLLGTVRLRPHAVDAETGALIPTSTLRLVDFGREKQVPPDAEGWFSGLPGGDLELRIHAPGYEESKLVARCLLPGESREVELSFSRAGQIRGVVVSEVSGAPLANVSVQLDWAGTPDKIRELMASRHLSGSEVRFSPAFPVRSDAQGRFTLDDLRLGEYSIRASQGALIDSVAQRVVLAAGDSVKEVVLRVAPGCSLAGTLTAGSDHEFLAGLGGMWVIAKLLGAPDPTRLDHTVARVQPDGQFRFEDGLPLERVQILLAPRSQGLGYGPDPASPGARVLGELALHPGENECSFDVSELLPGFAEVEVVTTGFEIDGGELLVAAHAGGAALETFDLRRPLSIVGPLPPGDYWMLARGDAWLSSTPVALHIARREASRVRLELRLVRGKIVVQDEGGAPLGEGTQLAVRSAGSSWSGPRIEILPTVGENGELALALEPGAYLVGSRPECALDWNAAGPAQSALRLALRR